MVKYPYKNATYSLRIDNNIAYKMKHIAKEEGRSLNNMYEQIAKAYVKQYEAEHGEIPIEPTQE